MYWLKRIGFFSVAACVISSCSLNPTPVVADENKQTATNNISLEIITDELDDMANVVLNSFNDSGLTSDGRVEALSDDRLTCPGLSIVFSNVSVDRTSGNVSITFPETGCSDGMKSNVRKGTINISWSGGKWYTVGSKHTITFNNFRLNDIVINGSRTLTCTVFTYANTKIWDVTWSVKANHTLTWPDGTSATFNVNKSKLWSHGAAGDAYRYTNGPDGDFSVNGVNRHGKSFTVSIQIMLIYTRSCKKISKNYMPIYGTEIITDATKGKTLYIDFGLYLCDAAYTLTVDGVNSTLYGKNDSSDD